MKKIILGILLTFMFLGCSADDATITVEPKLVVGKTLGTITLNDQFEKAHTISNDTKTVIFAFSKDMGHLCNDYFTTKEASYLADNKAVFIADLSSAPSLIRSMFIIPGLKDFKHTVLVLDDKSVAASFKAGLDTEKIVTITLSDGKIIDIKKAFSVNELKAIIEN